MTNLILLHGAIGAADHFDTLVAELGNDYNIHTLNFPGHGGAPMPEQGFSIPLFAEVVVNYMNDNSISTASFFGYSMGGYVAMYIAKHHPEKVEKLITLATKYYWDYEIAAKEVQMLNADKIMAKLPAFAAALEKRHAPVDWKVLLKRTGEMLFELGDNNTLTTIDYEAIKTPALIMLGDRDKMVTMEETVVVYDSLPNAQLAILPATPHPIEQVDTKLLAYHIRRFM